MSARIPAHRIFFPLAAVYAAIALPASVGAMTGLLPAIPGLATPARHAHEMLFGFGLAAVAGNQMGPMRPATLGSLVVAWIVARVAFLAAPGSAIAVIASAAFAVMLAWQLMPRVTASVRKWRNRLLPAAIVALCAVAVTAQLSASPAAGERVLLGGIVLIALVMFFMSGRIIAPTAAGHLYVAGINMPARVQPRIEGAVMAACAAAFVLVVVDATRFAGVFMAFAAAAAAVRLVRWQPWRIRGRRDIACLVIGYAWLVGGMAWIAASFLLGEPAVTAVHLVTVGAMGTLTVNVMALTWARLARVDPSGLVLPSFATALVAIATLLRVLAGSDPAHRTVELIAAAGAWSGAYLVLLLSFARISGRSAPRPA
jgi:uncharacterized protein involved in response to NO